MKIMYYKQMMLKTGIYLQLISLCRFYNIPLKNSKQITHKSNKIQTEGYCDILT